MGVLVLEWSCNSLCHGAVLFAALECSGNLTHTHTHGFYHIWLDAFSAFGSGFAVAFADVTSRVWKNTCSERGPAVRPVRKAIVKSAASAASPEGFSKLCSSWLLARHSRRPKIIKKQRKNIQKSSFLYAFGAERESPLGVMAARWLDMQSGRSCCMWFEMRICNDWRAGNQMLACKPIDKVLLC